MIQDVMGVLVLKVIIALNALHMPPRMLKVIAFVKHTMLEVNVRCMSGHVIQDVQGRVVMDQRVMSARHV